jgi:biopolymer transport protein ExbB
VAIPAAMAAHYFEGRITELFHDIDELLFNLLPQIERYEGRIRFGRNAEDEGTGNGEEAPGSRQQATELRP